MPVLQVQDRVLRCGEQLELRGAPGLADLTGLHVLTAEQAVHQLEARPAERDRDADPQHLVRAGVQERVARARSGYGRVDGGAAECLQLPAALSPVHRHEPGNSGWRPTGFVDSSIMPLLPFPCQIQTHIRLATDTRVLSESGYDYNTSRCT
jgi:hypothetical protein